MKKVKGVKGIKIKVNKESFLGCLRWSKNAISRLPRWLLIEHGHEVDVVLSILVLIIGAWFLVRVSFFAPPDVVVPEAKREELNVDIIDDLERWIEDVETKRSQGIVIKGSVF